MNKYVIYSLRGGKNLQLLPVNSTFSEDRVTSVNKKRFKSRRNFKVN